MSTPYVSGYSTLQVHDIIKVSGVDPEDVKKVLDARAYVLSPTPVFFSPSWKDAQKAEAKRRAKARRDSVKRKSKKGAS